MPLFDGVQPPAETPAQRYARDVSQRRGDWQYDDDNVADPKWGALVYVAPTATGGRTDREFLRRGGDRHFTYDENGAPVEELDVNGRNERIYVDYETGDSAVDGAGKFDHYDDLKANN